MDNLVFRDDYTICLLARGCHVNCKSLQKMTGLDQWVVFLLFYRTGCLVYMEVWLFSQGKEGYQD